MPIDDSLAAEVKAMALSAGFDAVGITTAAPPEHAEAMAAYLRAGMHGEMGYLERRAELRAGALSSPNLLDGARSVLTLAVSYNFDVAREYPTGSPNRPRGTIARYARGEDYHDPLRAKLNALGAEIDARWPGTRSRGFVDSGPIRERELAQRAGLGWQGRHTNLISLDLGNWFFLAALLTTLELPPDAPLESGGHCGTCTRCLSACPTGALVAPLTLDARRCISYLTIELKGSMPLEMRPLVGDRIFGCDDCLAICPWNERAQAARETRLAARDADAAHPDLITLLEFLGDEAAFKARYKGTPLLRTGRAGLRRNVCVALGNVGGVEALGALERVRDDDESEMVREHAGWAIGRIGLGADVGVT